MEVSQVPFPGLDPLEFVSKPQTSGYKEQGRTPHPLLKAGAARQRIGPTSLRIAPS